MSDSETAVETTAVSEGRHFGRAVQPVRRRGRGGRIPAVFISCLAGTGIKGEDKNGRETT